MFVDEGKSAQQKRIDQHEAAPTQYNAVHASGIAGLIFGEHAVEPAEETMLGALGVRLEQAGAE